MWAKKDLAGGALRSLQKWIARRGALLRDVFQSGRRNDAADESTGHLACRSLLAKKTHTNFLNVKTVSAMENSQ